MSNFRSPRLNEEEISSQSSDEKMDTGTESLHSRQHTPSSTLSSDYEDMEQLNGSCDVLRLQNHGVLRLSEPKELNDSLIKNMNNLQISSPVETRPKHLAVTKFSSTLMSTTDHPLMGIASPDENYPDLIPKKYKEDEKDLSLSSIEDERANETNEYFYSPQRNTSKNNLYINENFITAESHILSTTLDVTSPPDVARGIEKRKRLEKETPRLNRVGLEVKCERDSSNRLEALKLQCHSTPKPTGAVDIQEVEEFHTGVADWCESPSHLRTMPNFDLPIEMKTNIAVNNDLDSPDVISSSQEDRSAYQALLDPYTGSVMLRHTPAKSPGGQRRRIQLPPEDDQCSLDSASVRSLESEEEPPEPSPQPSRSASVQDDDSRRSTNTLSECSEPIPEYSAADELRDERSWLTVPRPGGRATCDMKVIEPYKRVVSHGGYDGAGAALIVFSACHLPDSARADYHYVMDNLFLYVIWTLERLVTDEYVLVYLYGSAGPRRLPTAHWLREYYKLVDRRLRKSLKHLYLVHPTYGLRLFVTFTKAFVSSKFFRKLSYVRTLSELMEQVPVEPNAIPEMVKQYDAGKR
ncbi:uncharacterized protein isoform X2 [Choristoneura fumiferana]|uniref:uncharacterized protein isoform X2 n=1 Tax=Choristoneura fumiferana TaxID=7141 RepID=UPI003D158184